jgi:hypothetical protein
VDCSHFVWLVYCDSFPSFQYCETAKFAGDQIEPTDTPKAGDFILWPHHVEIVADPVTGTFTAANGGIDEHHVKHGHVRFANYKTDRWVKRLGVARF